MYPRFKGRVVGLLLFLAGVLQIVKLIDSSDHPAIVTNIAETDCGPIEGVNYLETLGYVAFLGVPYSIKRQNRTRWLPPQGLKEAHQCWKGILKTQNYASLCIQPGGGSEDCLYMDIYAPDLKLLPKPTLPVILWIHGGGLFSGGSYAWYKTPEIFAREKHAVVVSMNYRLGFLGFMSLSELDEIDPRGVSGNYALLDILEVLKWINRNIRNKDLVTIFGQSAGSQLVLSTLAMPEAQPYFQRAMAMSSPITSFFMNKTQCQSDFRAAIEKSSCSGKTREDLVNCLYDITTGELVQLLGKTGYYFGWAQGIPPVDHRAYNLEMIDGVTIPMSVMQTFQQNKFGNKSVIFGIMREETDAWPGFVLYNKSTWVPWSQSQYENLIKSQFDPYAVKTHDPTLPAEVLSHYKYSDFDTPQQAFDQMGTDINWACGTLAFAREASKYQNHIYVYVGAQKPTKYRCINPIHYPSHYCWHTYDAMCMFNNTDVFVPDSSEREFGKFFRDSFVDFFRSPDEPQMDEKVWRPFKDDESLTVVRSTDQGGVVLTKNPKQEQCSFWEEKNFFNWPI